MLGDSRWKLVALPGIEPGFEIEKRGQSQTFLLLTLRRIAALQERAEGMPAFMPSRSVLNRAATLPRAPRRSPNGWRGDTFDEQPECQRDLEYQRWQPLIVSAQQPGGEPGKL